MHVIKVKNLTKIFKVPKKDLTKWQKIKNIFIKQHEIKKAIDNITFNVEKSELLGYLGLNGAGKSTTIKLLTGVLFPSKGTVKVLGYIPWKDRYEYVKNIGVVFGHKSILEYDIKAIESLKLFATIYELSSEEFKARLEYFNELLSLEKYYNIPVRKLSLGERMRFEIAANFLHMPKIVFLDEPTLGLDIFAKEKIRNFLLEMNKKEKTTIMLTTHYMEDVEQLCNRIILLDRGKIIYDGSLARLKKHFAGYKRIMIKFREIKSSKEFKRFKERYEILKHEHKLLILRIPIKQDIKEFIKHITQALDIIDLTIREPSLETIIKNVYKKES